MELVVAGQKFKVVSSADKTELHALAATVTAQIEAVTPRGRAIAPQSMLLAAMALAHDLAEERGKREALERRTRDALRRILVRVDRALDEADIASAPSLSLPDE